MQELPQVFNLARLLQFIERAKKSKIQRPAKFLTFKRQLSVSSLSHRCVTAFRSATSAAMANQSLATWFVNRKRLRSGRNPCKHSSCPACCLHALLLKRLEQRTHRR